MAKLGLVYDPIYLEHDTGQHVENAGRLTAVISHLENASLWSGLNRTPPRPATVQELALVHSMNHILRIQEFARRGGGWLDGDTVMSARSYEAALYAAGGAIRATEAVMDNEVDVAFALVRPPGHHATPDRAMGFCIFNNIAVAARHALDRYKLERVSIIDFDVHHGNGTNDAFYAEPAVQYISTHQYPFYPGSGSVEETGSGNARGTKVNIPLPGGCGDDQYLQVFDEVIAPAVRRFRPELILVSAGYDPHWTDPIGGMAVTTTGFARMTAIIKALGEELCLGRMVFALEGGYNPPALAASIEATLRILLSEREVEDPLGPPPTTRPVNITTLIQSIKDVHNL